MEDPAPASSGDVQAPTAEGKRKLKEFAIFHKMVDAKDVNNILVLQAEAIAAVRGSMDLLTAFTNGSADAYNRLTANFQVHTRRLQQIKADLQTVFTRIRRLKQRLMERDKELHPHRYANGVPARFRDLEDEEEEKEEEEEEESGETKKTEQAPAAAETSAPSPGSDDDYSSDATVESSTASANPGAGDDVPPTAEGKAAPSAS